MARKDIQIIYNIKTKTMKIFVQSIGILLIRILYSLLVILMVGLFIAITVPPRPVHAPTPATTSRSNFHN